MAHGLLRGHTTGLGKGEAGISRTVVPEGLGHSWASVPGGWWGQPRASVRSWDPGSAARRRSTGALLWPWNRLPEAPGGPGWEPPTLPRPGRPRATFLLSRPGLKTRGGLGGMADTAKFGPCAFSSPSATPDAPLPTRTAERKIPERCKGLEKVEGVESRRCEAGRTEGCGRPEGEGGRGRFRPLKGKTASLYLHP